jgi:hypothetical protein
VVVSGPYRTAAQDGPAGPSEPEPPTEHIFTKLKRLTSEYVGKTGQAPTDAFLPFPLMMEAMMTHHHPDDPPPSISRASGNFRFVTSCGVLTLHAAIVDDVVVCHRA